VGFIYTTCVDTCSLLTLQMKEVETWMPQEWQGRVQFLSVTIDPEQDTPEVLRKYAARFEALSAAWSFLTASEETIKALTISFLSTSGRKAQPIYTPICWHLLIKMEI